MALPKDFTWAELKKLLKGEGYVENQSGKTSGSRVRFMHDEHAPITLHKPHPRPHMKAYQVRQIVDVLKQRGQL